MTVFTILCLPPSVLRPTHRALLTLEGQDATLGNVLRPGGRVANHFSSSWMTKITSPINLGTHQKLHFTAICTVLCRLCCVDSI